MRKLAFKKGLLAESQGTAAASQQPASVQLPSHGPDVEQQFRRQQQQQQTAATARQRQQQPGTAGGGIITIASVANGEGSSAASSSANLLASSAAAAASGGSFGGQSGLWGVAGGWSKPLADRVRVLLSLGHFESICSSFLCCCRLFAFWVCFALP